MKNFFSSISKSIYSPDYYKELRTKSVGSAVGYFAKFGVLVSLVLAIVLTIIWYPRVQNFFSEFGEEILSAYPQELVVSLEEGKIQTNVAEPYYFPWPEELVESSETDVDGRKFESLLVIDTTQPFSIEAFENYSAFIWLTEDSVVYYDRSAIQIQSLADVPDYTINYDIINQFVGKVDSILSSLPVFIMPVGIFIATFFYFIFRAVYMFILALIILLLSLILHLGLRYSDAYKLGLHAMTLPILFTGLLLIAGAHVGFMLFFSILTLAMIVINVRKDDSVASHEDDATKSY